MTAGFLRFQVDPFRAPEPLPILNPSNFVPKNGFPVAEGLTAPLNNRFNVFFLMHTVRCGFNGIPTVRFGAVVYPTVRFGAVFRNQESYGAVRVGFEEGKSPKAWQPRRIAPNR